MYKIRIYGKHINISSDLRQEWRVNMKKIKKRSPEKMMSFIITGALVCALAVGVISVAGRAYCRPE